MTQVAELDERAVIQGYDKDDRSFSLLAKDQYFRQVYWTEKLVVGEEAMLLRRVERGRWEREHPCPNQWVLSLAKQARDRLVEGYQPLVIHIARRYQARCRSMELLDLIQEGNVGLLKAVEQYTAAKGVAFGAVAGRCIQDAMVAAVWDRDTTVSLPRRARWMLSQMRRVERELTRVLGHQPPLAEIAAQMQVREEKLCELIEWEQQVQVLSLHRLLEENEEEEEDQFVGLYGVVQEGDAGRNQALLGWLRSALETALTPRQREIFCLRHGLSGGQPLKHIEVAALLGISVNCATTLESEARKRLCKALTALAVVEEGLSA